MKKFWKKTEGFTLVELVVVIAILGILAGVGTVGYSGYVKKANMQADITLAKEVENALLMYYYGNPSANVEGYVHLKKDAAPVTDNNGFGAAAMEAAFGANWESQAVLKSGEWAGANPDSYAGTSYYGQENMLMGKVGGLTEVLTNALNTGTNEAIIGDGFKNFYEGYGLELGTDNRGIGNAAVLYVAQNTAGKQDFINRTVQNNLSTSPDANLLINDLKGEIGTAAALAVVYAAAEGLALSSGKEFNVNFDLEPGQVMDQQLAIERVSQAFGTLVVDAYEDGSWAAYQGDISNAQNSNLMKDLDGYLNIMDTVNKNKDIVNDNLKSDDCFTDGKVEGLLRGYASLGNLGVQTDDGEIAVGILVSNGVIATTTLPLDLNA